MATFWTYDYACSLVEEWTFLLGSRWTRIKSLYIVTRIMPFFLLVINLYQNFTPTEDFNKCRILGFIDLALGIISVTCSESFFILRTYALWNNNRIVLAAMLTAFFATFVASIVTSLVVHDDTAPYATGAIPGMTGCLLNGRLSIPYILLFQFELGLIFLTLIRAIQSWRTANSPLYAILVKHNIFYYACGLLFSGVNVVTSFMVHYQYHAMFQDFQFIILAILALHMHLQLWQINEHVHGSDAPVSNLECIPLPNVSFASDMA
ncbi:uncharacterized protein EDB91DRAFT_383925 [Suillus paluster]|uniref:uncharacterized protein n=1 Tax=Suillus paluster TaxID=48578 RepID=UPI001B864929|nr:uncharacterized protein EDB91DRAFT_383925 [Suillus paluster]KAG1739423.1 hypothetical protein EDB91DRAFT_383925 [Suillus paluster]